MTRPSGSAPPEPSSRARTPSEPLSAAPTIDEVRAAAARIRPWIHRTPVLTCKGLDELAGCSLFFKPECLQKVGAFKARGAHNAVFSLSEAEAAAGVATHSSGNHAAALALAARNRGISAHIVMPRTAPAVKKTAVAGYGATITFCEPTLQAREEGLRSVVERTGATVVHPYNDPRVIAGQGTAALELLEDVPDLDLMLAPVGGGGLMSGTAITTSALAPSIRIIGTEPAGADDAFRSLEAGRLIPSEHPETIADGLLTSLGTIPFAVLSEKLERIVTVTEGAIVQAMRHIFERMKLVVEPSAAVPLGALLETDFGQCGKRIGLILSGGNVELGKLPWPRDETGGMTP